MGLQPTGSWSISFRFSSYSTLSKRNLGGVGIKDEDRTSNGRSADLLPLAMLALPPYSILPQRQCRLNSCCRHTLFRYVGIIFPLNEHEQQAAFYFAAAGILFDPGPCRVKSGRMTRELYVCLDPASSPQISRYPVRFGARPFRSMTSDSFFTGQSELILFISTDHLTHVRHSIVSISRKDSVRFGLGHNSDENIFLLTKLNSSSLQFLGLFLVQHRTTFVSDNKHTIQGCSHDKYGFTCDRAVIKVPNGSASQYASEGPHVKWVNTCRDLARFGARLRPRYFLSLLFDPFLWPARSERSKGIDTAWLRMVRTYASYTERPVYVSIPFDSGLGHRGERCNGDDEWGFGQVLALLLLIILLRDAWGALQDIWEKLKGVQEQCAELLRRECQATPVVEKL
ncbi:hypothetical protein DFH08DRAFT_824901 [Mycena albidolilacea]|uniref:Uncharacterized protein n=1 Tax=Mycena albidolilacea TaxID=1033008 RepID=A0AAD7E9P2_9AGAR|nr:hypothetical protein DFH08DRAFT_824901 [Mycena albidolilacea]